LNTEGFHLAVCRTPDGLAWCIEVANRRAARVQLGKRRYETEHEAKEAALDALLWAKEHLA